jgi:hypothetical protein
VRARLGPDFLGPTPGPRFSASGLARPGPARGMARYSCRSGNVGTMHVSKMFILMILVVLSLELLIRLSSGMGYKDEDYETQAMGANLLLWVAAETYSRKRDWSLMALRIANCCSWMLLK